MRYGFSCDACAQEQEVSCTWAERPATLPCACGGVASPVITGGREAFMKGRPMVYEHKYTMPNMGTRYGVSDEQQDRIYGGRIREARKKNAQRRRSLSRKDGFDHVGKMPLEIEQYIMDSTGDKGAVMKDPETWLKKTGCWTGE